MTREEIRQQVWHGDTFVDFDQGLNFCIRQIREALGDNAESPQFIETLPRRGYRFVAPVESADIGEGRGADSPDRAAVPHVAARRRDRLPRLQPAGCPDEFALRARIPRRALEPRRPRASAGTGWIRERSVRKRTWTSSSQARCFMPVTGSGSAASSPTPRRARCSGPTRRRCLSGTCFRSRTSWSIASSTRCRYRSPRANAGCSGPTCPPASERTRIFCAAISSAWTRSNGVSRATCTSDASRTIRATRRRGRAWGESVM